MGFEPNAQAGTVEQEIACDVQNSLWQRHVIWAAAVPRMTHLHHQAGSLGDTGSPSVLRRQRKPCASRSPLAPGTAVGKLRNLQPDIGLAGVQPETNCAGLADRAAGREAIRLLAREVKSAFC